MILFQIFSVISIAQPFNRQVQWEKYFEDNIQNLDPIEGIWSISTKVSVSYKNDFQESDVPYDEMVAIYKDGNSYNIYSLDQYDNYSNGTFQNTSIPRLYIFKIFYSRSNSTAKTNASLTADGLLEFSYNEPDAETEISMGDDYVSGIKFNYEHKWIKISPKGQNKTKVQPKSGTGFGISSNGIIVTNHHVIDGAKLIYIRGMNSDFNKTYKAKVLVSDKNNDLSLIQVEGDNFNLVDTIPFAIRTSLAEVGENIFVLGYPLRATMGDEIKLTNGIVSSRTGFQGDVTSYQISAPIQPGSSGGPLFDSQGNLIGVINAKHIGAENASYAVKSSYLSNLFELLPNPPKIQTLNSLTGKSLTNQVELLKKFIYIIEAE